MIKYIIVCHPSTNISPQVNTACDKDLVCVIGIFYIVVVCFFCCRSLTKFITELLHHSETCPTIETILDNHSVFFRDDSINISEL